MLRFHGSHDKKDFHLIGFNSRLDEMQAAALRLFLPHLDGWNAARREAAARYAALGLGELCEIPSDEDGHVYHMYVVRSPERDRIARRSGRGGDLLRLVLRHASPSPARAALPRLGGRDRCPRPSAPPRENLALPMWAGIDEATQERVVERRP